MSRSAIHMKSNKPISLSLDTLARAIYITFSNNPVAKTIRKDPCLSFDYDDNNNLVGIEVIRLKQISATFKKILKDTENILPPECKKIVDNLIPA